MFAAAREQLLGGRASWTSCCRAREQLLSEQGAEVDGRNGRGSGSVLLSIVVEAELGPVDLTARTPLHDGGLAPCGEVLGELTMVEAEEKLSLRSRSSESSLWLWSLRGDAELTVEGLARVSPW